MTLDEILESLFPSGYHLIAVNGILYGHATRPAGGSLHVIGITDGIAPGVDETATLSRYLLDVFGHVQREPIVVLVDSSSQRMSKRDELLGLNEYLAHLAKCLFYASSLGHPTVGLLYGNTAAGAFLATALAARTLAALPGAHPEVMDLPSIARVTKLPMEWLESKAKSNPVFAPGLDNLAQTGAVHEVWDPRSSLAAQLESAIRAQTVHAGDLRDELGLQRKGRPKAAPISDRVYQLAIDAF
ncbi:biotin-independent malonate decarboxylase subunit gamma [Paraburkholderia rhizosphaerae]|uniref:Malonate decarboxylase gamma subunit n=1 Tax=Paraburkholderia rhizosphaerae TaxID=480658 RepID=A0A4R8M0H0_9BURK|nr:biotin-independent malonate decarboxylase subunit gamma [Paraburkholderia rhizosphaerae]TDY54746.1 malonate decarboxylase gamma subunit [Paraburkholderia rhizosphaerae]